MCVAVGEFAFICSLDKQRNNKVNPFHSPVDSDARRIKSNATGTPTVAAADEYLDGPVSDNAPVSGKSLPDSGRHHDVGLAAEHHPVAADCIPAHSTHNRREFRGTSNIVGALRLF